MSCHALLLITQHELILDILHPHNLHSICYCWFLSRPDPTLTFMTVFTFSLINNEEWSG